MLSWTGAGAVQRPEVLQIRLQRTYPGRVRAGAPVPTREMATAEVLENLRWFTTAGSRGLPIRALVLSGVGAASRPDLGQICGAARGLGVERITLHAGVEDLEGMRGAGGDLPGGEQAGGEQAGGDLPVPPVDRLILPLAAGDAGAALSTGAEVLWRLQAQVEVSVSCTLSAANLPMLEAIARVLLRTQTRMVSFTYPFPVDGSVAAEVPPPAAVMAALGRVLPGLMAAGVQVDIKGLPRCYLGPWAACARRTGNRWYVDADHQTAGALLFFPDVVAFFKGEDCRFCTADAACDGFFATYLRRPGFPELRPFGETA